MIYTYENYEEYLKEKASNKELLLRILDEYLTPCGIERITLSENKEAVIKDICETVAFEIRLGGILKYISCLNDSAKVFYVSNTEFPSNCTNKTIRAINIYEKTPEYINNLAIKLKMLGEYNEVYTENRGNLEYIIQVKEAKIGYTEVDIFATDILLGINTEYFQELKKFTYTTLDNKEIDLLKTDELKLNDDAQYEKEQNIKEELIERIKKTYETQLGLNRQGILNIAYRKLKGKKICLESLTNFEAEEDIINKLTYEILREHVREQINKQWNKYNTDFYGNIKGIKSFDELKQIELKKSCRKLSYYITKKNNCDANEYGISIEIYIEYKKNKNNTYEMIMKVYGYFLNTYKPIKWILRDFKTKGYEIREA